MNKTIDISHSQEILTVTQFNREVRLILEGSFPCMWIEGEISNFATPNSGHWYFSLKDNAAAVRCAMFRTQNRRLTFTPKDGQHVIVKARVSFYEGRGEFQLLVEHIEEAGIGKLQKAFEALKKRLTETGLFDSAHKKPLPKLPRRIGIITSTTGAAIRDILHVLKRRFCIAPIIIYPTLVQGDFAAGNIVEALKTANRRKECDVLILARGGGSIEDLWPFNEEAVALAIHQSMIPIVSGVGHEIDFTIADFVADVRAPTPSAAAELVSPDIQDLSAYLSEKRQYLERLIQQKYLRYKETLLWLEKHLFQQHPKRRLRESMQHLDLLEATMIRCIFQLIQARQMNFHDMKLKLQELTPIHQIRSAQHNLQLNQHILENRMTNLLTQSHDQFIHLTAKLNALSPLATLKRGFTIATIHKNKTILRKRSQVKKGDKIDLTLSDGDVSCIIDN
jgi:exodeoxyribonuclease VII large subunit